MKSPLTHSEAEIAFKSYGCTHFHMARDEPPLYKRYKAANIHPEQELEWRLEIFRGIRSKINSREAEEENLWKLHSQATDLIEKIGNLTLLQELQALSEKVLETIPARDSVLCAENILDRRALEARCGVIFEAFALNRPDLASNFLITALAFANKYQGNDRKRVGNAVQRAYAIAKVLKLEIKGT